LHQCPSLKELGRPIIVDLYDPFTIENLHFHAQKPLVARSAIHRNDLAVLNDQLQAGDYFLCASEKQRDYWLGLLMANNRINPITWDRDPALRELIDVVPFGLRSRPPRADGPKVKGVRPGIGATDQLILWGGGVWEWLDPLTTIRALPRVVEACPRARLLFIGIRHPNPGLPDSRMASRAIDLSRELGLLDRHVFFNDWTPYAEREGYLLEADVGISTHFDHLETRFAFRTRLLDYFWAGLPVVTSHGDALSDVVAAEGLGRVVGCEDVEGVAEALIELLSVPDAKQRLAPAFERVREQFAWERVAAPLVAFCRTPHRAADRAGVETHHPGVIVTPEPTPVWRLPARAWRIMRERGLGGLGMEALSYVRWLVTRVA
jgi:glycosyltransferase involved in cell wall biosynthesis